MTISAVKKGSGQLKENKHIFISKGVLELDRHCTTARVIFKQQKTFSVFEKPDINTRGVGRIRDPYANTRLCLGFA